jgi:hypothetical protein
MLGAQTAAPGQSRHIPLYCASRVLSRISQQGRCSIGRCGRCCADRDCPVYLGALNGVEAWTTDDENVRYPPHHMAHMLFDHLFGISTEEILEETMQQAESLRFGLHGVHAPSRQCVDCHNHAARDCAEMCCGRCCRNRQCPRHGEHYLSREASAGIAARDSMASVRLMCYLVFHSMLMRHAEIAVLFCTARRRAGAATASAGGAVTSTASATVTATRLRCFAHNATHNQMNVPVPSRVM